jgi:putative transposase
MPLTQPSRSVSTLHAGTHVRHALRSPERRRSAPDYQAFSSRLRDGLVHYPLRLLAYQILPMECHLVVGPTEARRAEALLRWVTDTLRGATIGSNVPGSDIHSIALSNDLVATCCEVERLPLIAGLVRRAQDWPWGSLADRLRPEERVPLARAPFLSSRAWVDFVNAPVADSPNWWHGRTTPPGPGATPTHRPCGVPR